MKILNSRIAVISDLHIGLHHASSVWHDTSIQFCEWLNNKLTELGIRDILILGDVLDNRNEVSVTTLHTLYKCFKILENFNINITIGNHDCYYSKRSDVHSLGMLKDWPNVNVIDKTTTVNMFNKTLTFCPWHTDVSTIPKSDIIFGHFEINTFKMNGRHLCESGIHPSDILAKTGLVLTGHFHSTEKRVYKDGTILYTGSPYEQNWGEAGDPKGIYLLDIIDLDLQFIANTVSPKHKKIRLSEMLAIGSISNSIKNEFHKNIINLVIDSPIPQETIDSLVTKLYTLSPQSLKVDYLIPEEMQTVDVDITATYEGINIKSDILSFISSFDSIANKESVVKYILDVLDKCEQEQK